MTNKTESFLPTPTQELLLKAVLAKGDEAFELWQKWKSRVDLNDADAGSQRLLPHLCRNLLNDGRRDPIIDRYKGVYRLFWYKNQMLFKAGADVLRSFHQKGIKTALIKGAAMTVHYYKDPGLRPMDDFDVLVPTNRTYDAIEAIQKEGYLPTSASRLRFSMLCVPLIHAYGFVNPKSYEVDLHWHLLPESCQEWSDDGFWAAAVPTTMNGIPTHVLSPTDQLFQILVTGARWEMIPTLRWVVDAITVLRSSPIDWNILAEHAGKHRVVLPVRDTLLYLRDRLNVPVPDTTLQALQKIPTLRIERLEYRYKTRNYERRLLGHLPMHWFDYLRLNNFSFSISRPFGFMRYMQNYWGLQRLWHVPIHALRLASRKVSQSVSGTAHLNQISYNLQKLTSEVSTAEQRKP